MVERQEEQEKKEKKEEQRKQERKQEQEGSSTQVHLLKPVLADPDGRSAERVVDGEEIEAFA
jgi:hypothetical protein